jgi:hypothetical protein
MVDTNIDIFEMSYEESVSYFKRLENLEKIRGTNGPNPFSLPIGNKKRVPVTSTVGKSSKIIRGSTYGVTILTRTTTTRLIEEQFPFLNSRKKLALKPKLNPERVFDLPFRRNEPGKKSFVFLFEEMNALKRQLQLKPEKNASSEKWNKEV